jgi:pimeloyl-ACP methyl ester carboxylesterase
MKAIGGLFDGTINKDLTAIEGTWTQGGATMPLALKRAKDAAELERRRPQNPAKPYPYREEDVAYDNKLADIKLAATLTIPPGKGPFPAVILVAGSGPHDRDEAVFGHKPFLVLSDYLTRKGIVVLRYDKRGFGQSGGDLAAATTADFATGAEAGMVYLKGRPEANSHKIGLIGHSEGGVIAPMVAARNPGRDLCRDDGRVGRAGGRTAGGAGIVDFTSHGCKSRERGTERYGGAGTIGAGEAGERQLGA